MPTTQKTFDAVAESRKWREATSRRLDAMSETERAEYLRGAWARLRKKNALEKPRMAAR